MKPPKVADDGNQQRRAKQVAKSTADYVEIGDAESSHVACLQETC